MSARFRVCAFRSVSGPHRAVVVRNDSDAPTALSAGSRRSQAAALRNLARLLADLHADAVRRADALEQEARP